MRAIVWGVAGAALVVWSLLAWGGHALLDWSSDWAAANADKLSSAPEIVEWSSWALRGIGDASEILVLILWALGAILVVGIAGVVNRLLAGRRPTLAYLKTWRR